MPPNYVSSQIACGLWLFASLKSGTVRVAGKVMSNFPEMKANVAVDMFFMIVHSMPSR